MFNNADHAKKVTKSLFDAARNNSNLKLSEFRESLASKVGFNSFFDLLNNITPSQELNEISILELLTGDCIIQINGSITNSVTLHTDFLEIFYAANEPEFKDNCLYNSEHISYADLARAKIDGNTVIVTDGFGYVVKFSVYIPLGNESLKITNNLSNLIDVRCVKENQIITQYMFLNNEDGKSGAFRIFCDLLSTHCSSFDDMSDERIQEAWDNGYENIGRGTVEVITPR